MRQISREKLGGRLKEAGGRIRAAAERGEISEDEAWAEWYATRDELIDTAVEAGEISAEDARSFRDKTHQAELKERIGAAGDQIKAAVVVGEKTEDEGWAAWAEARDELIAEAEEAGEISAETADEFRQGYERWTVGQRLKAAVASGAMTEEEAWAAWAEYNGEPGQIEEKLAEMVKRGEITAEEAEAKLLAIEKALGGKGGRATLDARTVLKAIKRVELTRDQKDNIRDIEREAIGAFRKISRKDKQAHAELATQVKAEIDKLLKPEQAEQFEAALKQLVRASRQGRQPARSKVVPERDPHAKESP
jgi:polyhydroxyalkanoate synthesis regulator phasin